MTSLDEDERLKASSPMQILTFGLSSEVRSQDADYFFYSVCQSKAGRELAWEYFKENVDTLKERFKGSILIRIVSDITTNFASEEKALEIESFFKVIHINFHFIVKSVANIKYLGLSGASMPRNGKDGPAERGIDPFERSLAETRCCGRWRVSLRQVL